MNFDREFVGRTGVDHYHICPSCRKRYEGFNQNCDEKESILECGPCTAKAINKRRTAAHGNN